MAYDLTPRVGDSAHRLLFKIAAATSDVDDPPNPDAPENQLLRRIAAATAAGAGAGGAAWGDITGTLSAQTDLQNALDAKMNTAGGAFSGLTSGGFRDASAAFDVILGFSSSTPLVGAVSLDFDMKGSARSITLNGNLTVPATGTAALLGTENVFTAAQTITAGLTVSSAPLGISTNGSVSAPALAGTGTIFTGGSATTTKPYWLIEPTGTTSTNWSTSGTLYGGNAPSGFVGNLIDLQLNGANRFSVTSTGVVTFASSTLSNTAADTLNVVVNGTTRLSIFGSLGIIHTGIMYYDSFGGTNYSSSGSARDVQFYADAADTWAQRRGANAQINHLYGTYTNASNYVRLALNTTSTTMGIACETAGTGADNIDLGLTPAGTGLVAISSAASADAALVSTHSARIKFNGTEYKILLATP